MFGEESNYKTWILVADGAQAKVLAYDKPRRPLRVINSDLSHINAASQDLVTTKQGRVFHSADGSRSAMERPTDPHEHEKRKFATELSEYLSNKEERFNRLILVSAPKMLGYLRESMPPQIKRKIIEEVSKDLTNISHEQLDDAIHKAIDLKKVNSSLT